MLGRTGSCILLIAGLVTASSAHAAATGADGARFAAALLAGHARAPALQGTGLVTQASTAGCATHLAAGRESWTIDWKAASISTDSTPAVLKVLMDRNNPDQEFWIRVGNPAQGRIARAAGEHLIAACSAH